MHNRLTLKLLVLLLGSVFVTGCTKVNEPWDPTDYFKEERTVTPEQRKALQHRLAYSREGGSDQPWVHAQH
jgi:thioredoxin-related protein